MVRPLSALVPTRDYAESVLGKIKLAAFHFYMDTGYALLSWILAGKEPGFARVELVDTIPRSQTGPSSRLFPLPFAAKTAGACYLDCTGKKPPPRVIDWSYTRIGVSNTHSTLSHRFSRGVEDASLGPPMFVLPSLSVCSHARTTTKVESQIYLIHLGDWKLFIAPSPPRNHHHKPKSSHASPPLNPSSNPTLANCVFHLLSSSPDTD